MSKDKPRPIRLDNSGLKIAIVCARYNQDLTDALLDQTVKALFAGGILKSNIQVVRVPGSNEIPYAAASLAELREVHSIIALGVVIAGATHHHLAIGESTAHAIQKVAVDYSVPVINGIIVVDDRRHAEERITGSLRRGEEYAQAALEMAALCSHFDERLRQLEEQELKRQQSEMFDYGTDEDDDADYWKKS